MIYLLFDNPNDKGLLILLKREANIILASLNKESNEYLYKKERFEEALSVIRAIEYTKAQAFQVGVFSNYDNASRVALRNNGVVINDGDVYRVYVALLTDDEVIKKLESYYKEIGLNYYLKDITVNNKFTDSINSYEKMLLKSSTETYGTINLDILHKYQESL